MRTVLSLLLGFALGAAVGATLVMLFAPASGEQIAHDLKKSMAATMDEARRASEKRRAELEAELARRRGQPVPVPRR